MRRGRAPAPSGGSRDPGQAPARREATAPSRRQGTELAPRPVKALAWRQRSASGAQTERQRAEPARRHGAGLALSQGQRWRGGPPRNPQRRRSEAA